MPGVNVTTAIKSGPSSANQTASGQFFVVGQFERGDVVRPVKVRSLAEVARNFGGRTTYSDAYDQLVTFFSEGGSLAVVQRVVGSTASVGALTLNDRATTPQATLRVDAANPGAWSSRLTVEVKDGPSANTFRIIVRLDGDIVEDFNNLSSPADAVNKFSASPYVRLTNLGSVTAVPNNNPAVIAPTALTAGNDQRGNVNTASYTAALAKFTPEYGDGAVAVPGQTGSVIWDALVAHAKTNNRLALLASAKGESITNLENQSASLNSEYAGLFAPWVVVPAGANSTKSISPEGYVAACRARAHEAVGPWRTPAGAIAAARYVVDLDQTFTNDQSNELDAAKVSVIRLFSGIARLYGWRSLANDADNWMYLKDRDLLNRISVDAKERLEQFLFETVDNKGQLLSRINAELTAMLDPIARVNGLYGRYNENGDEIDPGYIVNTGAEVNTSANLAQNTVNADIGVRVSPTGALINLSITKVNLLGSL